MRTRDTARAILLDPEQRIYLLKIDAGGVFAPGQTSSPPFWVTPGGRIEEGERPEDAVAREVREETGLTGCAIGPQVWYGEKVLIWKAVPTLMRERFYLVRTPSAHVSADGMGAAERSVVRADRWWNAHEISASGELFVPPRLGELLAQLLARTPERVVEIDLEMRLPGD